MSTPLPRETRSARLSVLAELTARLGEIGPALEAMDTALAALRERDGDVLTELMPEAWSAAGLAPPPPSIDPDDEQPVLVLLAACCHPSLPEAARIALMLRVAAGLPLDEVARAFGVTPDVMTQRLAWSAHRIRPVLTEPVATDQFEPQLCRVLDVLLLLFDDGIAHSQMHVDLPYESVETTRVVVEIFHSSQEPRALLALMLLTRARRDARQGDDGALVPLEAQNRDLWHRDEIEEGLFLLRSSKRAGRNGPHQVRASIQATHVAALHAEDTDWDQLMSLHDELLRLAPSNAVVLARATAMAAVRGPQSALDTIERLGLDSHLYHATRAHLLRWLGRDEEADAAWTEAVSRVRQEAEPEQRSGELGH